MFNKGPLLALISSALFGVSPVLAKMLSGEMNPVLLAGLLYLGSGIALVFVSLLQSKSLFAELVRLSRRHQIKLLGAIFTGGVLAPLCFTYALQQGSAFEVSLLLNLESVTTTVIAWLLFKEHVGKSVWLGKVLLILGGIIISINPDSQFAFSASSLLIFGACVFWGFDNNLTRDIDEISPVILAATKGIVAGVFNLGLAIALQKVNINFGVTQAGSALLIGAFSYGLSLVLFIQALRFIGTARTSTYFAFGPFLGMLFAIILLDERPQAYQWFSALIMGAGLWVLFKESHEHEHTHEAITHSHLHSHDEHHRHTHESQQNCAKHEHEHKHTHEPIKHSHKHYPDTHHRHGHSDN